RWQLARSRCDGAVRGADLCSLQPEAAYWPRSHETAGRRTEMAAAAPRGSEQGMGEVVRHRRSGGAGAGGGAGSEPGEHVDRCRDRRPRGRARPHHSCSLGPDRRTDRSTVRPVMAARYWIVSPKAMAKIEKIGRFRDWLLGEAADDAR